MQSFNVTESGILTASLNNIKTHDVEIVVLTALTADINVVKI